MKPIDFIHIRHFTLEDVHDSGADLDGVQYDTIYNLDRLCEMYGRPISILRNGLNSGSHASTEHRDGLAVDVFVGDINKAAAVKLCLMAAACGFSAIGVYLNERGVYSFHFAISKRWRTWRAEKGEDGQWVYSGLSFL